MEKLLTVVLTVFNKLETTKLLTILAKHVVPTTIFQLILSLILILVLLVTMKSQTVKLAVLVQFVPNVTTDTDYKKKVPNVNNVMSKIVSHVTEISTNVMFVILDSFYGLVKFTKLDNTLFSTPKIMFVKLVNLDV